MIAVNDQGCGICGAAKWRPDHAEWCDGNGRFAAWYQALINERWGLRGVTRHPSGRWSAAQRARAPGPAVNPAPTVKPTLPMPPIVHLSDTERREALRDWRQGRRAALGYGKAPRAEEAS